MTIRDGQVAWDLNGRTATDYRKAYEMAASGEIGEVRIGKVEKKGKHNRRVNIHLE